MIIHQSSMRPLFFTSTVVLAFVVTRLLAADAIGPEHWYYHDGPLAGSLKSREPLPLYHADAHHLWNRVFAALYIRPGEDPGPGQPRRIEGGDAYPDPLLWPLTLWPSEPDVFTASNRVLDEFLETNGAALVREPIKRALFQHDLWAVHDRLARQNAEKTGDAAAVARRKILCRKLAAIIKAVALSREAIRALPSNYPLALQSGYFVARHQFDPKRDYLPTDLPTGSGNSTSGDWTEITNPGNAPPYHTRDFGGRSYFRIFYRFPEGRKAVEDYLKYVAEEGSEVVADMPQIPEHRRARLKGAGRDAAGSGESIRQM